MRYLLIGLLFFAAEAKAFTPLSTDHVSFDIWNNHHYHEPYQPEILPDEWQTGSAINYDLRLMQVFSWKNKIHMNSAHSKVQHAGWEFFLSMDYFKRVQPFYWHHSQHALDDEGRSNETGRYPIFDRVGLRFCFYGCKSGIGNL